MELHQTLKKAKCMSIVSWWWLDSFAAKSYLVPPRDRPFGGLLETRASQNQMARRIGFLLFYLVFTAIFVTSPTIFAFDIHSTISQILYPGNMLGFKKCVFFFCWSIPDYPIREVLHPGCYPIAITSFSLFEQIPCPIRSRCSFYLVKLPKRLTPKHCS